MPGRGEDESISGVGVFSGRPATLALRPGPAGVTWHTLPATIANLSVDLSWAGLGPGVPVRNTTIAGSGMVFATIEHVMGALAGLGIWQAAIALDGVEVPILDGSAAAFVALAHALPRVAPPPLVLAAPVEVRRGDASIIATPLAHGEPLEYVYELDYGPQSPIPRQRAAWRGDAGDFALAIAPARTFSLRREVEQARALGLFRHLSPKELLVVGDDGRPIDNAWRLPDEPARHKLLDLIGDLALLGRPLHARVVATRSGHALTHEFCRVLLRSLPSAAALA